jgi:hypothetical protein
MSLLSLITMISWSLGCLEDFPSEMGVPNGEGGDEGHQKGLTS